MHDRGALRASQQAFFLIVSEIPMKFSLVMKRGDRGKCCTRASLPCGPLLYEVVTGVGSAKRRQDAFWRLGLTPLKRIYR